jgi:ABC-type multidrug transport system ATPase subunit
MATLYIAGKQGAGKTTLERFLMQEARPPRGELQIRQVEVGDPNPTLEPGDLLVTLEGIHLRSETAEGATPEALKAAGWFTHSPSDQPEEA